VVNRCEHRSSLFFLLTLVTGSRRSLSLKLSDTRIYEPQMRTPLYAQVTHRTFFDEATRLDRGVVAVMIDSGLVGSTDFHSSHPQGHSGRGTTRADDAQGTPTQSHTSPSILVYEDTCTMWSSDAFPVTHTTLFIQVLHQAKPYMAIDGQPS